VRVGDQAGPLMVQLHRTAASLIRCYEREQDRLDLPLFATAPSPEAAGDSTETTPPAPAPPSPPS
jgi:hypothetical protein